MDRSNGIGVTWGGVVVALSSPLWHGVNLATKEEMRSLHTLISNEVGQKGSGYVMAAIKDSCIKMLWQQGTATSKRVWHLYALS